MKKTLVFRNGCQEFMGKCKLRAGAWYRQTIEFIFMKQKYICHANVTWTAAFTCWTVTALKRNAPGWHIFSPTHRTLSEIKKRRRMVWKAEKVSLCERKLRQLEISHPCKMRSSPISSWRKKACGKNSLGWRTWSKSWRRSRAPTK